MCALCPYSCAPEKISRSIALLKIALDQTRLTQMFFRYRLLKNKMHLNGMSTLLIILILDLGYHKSIARKIVY
jgi:hypothetical protein